MLKRLFQILCILPIMVIGSAYAVTCQSNEFEYNGECIENKFQITTTNDTSNFIFHMSARGTFYIDWGDGTVEMINRTGTTFDEISHDYDSANTYTIRFGGLATGYNSSTWYYSAIQFGVPVNISESGDVNSSPTTNTNLNLATISGSLGTIFPIIGDGGTYATSPIFYAVFRKCTNLTGPIPGDLFGYVKNGEYIGCDGLAAPAYIFRSAFAYAGFTGAIPDTLFGRYVNGVYHGFKITNQSSVFRSAFMYSTHLTGTDIDDPNNPGKKYAIPPNLFAGIDGGAPGYSFYRTFVGCTGLSGTIPEDLFGREINGEYYGINGAPNGESFQAMFFGCTGLTGAIPEKLFTRTINGIKYGIKGTGSAYGRHFFNTFYNCTGLSGTNIDDPNNPGMKYAIPPKLFDGVTGKPVPYLFSNTFYNCSGLTGTIPAGLFSGLSGKPAQNIFYQTFYGCSGLTGTIPGNLFNGLSGAPAANMFYQTFYGCSSLTGSIPGTLFSGISGTPASNMFYGTFYDCSGLSGTDIDDPNNPGMKYAIPPTLFSGVSGIPEVYMFAYTFRGCSGLTGSIPGNLFSGISGRPTNYMFYYTFQRCSNLTGPIPANLFSGLSGKPALYMFEGTFVGCNKLSGTDIDDPNNPGMKYALPPTLFSGISGAPAANMFRLTFDGCTGLTGSIPGTLFSGISGKPAQTMYSYLFRGCSGLTGSIPGNLFAGINGQPAIYMFFGTFQNCSKLTGSIPGDLFAGIIGKPASNMFAYAFYKCTNLGKNYIGGTSTYYVPPELFAGIDKTSTATQQMYAVFAESGLRTSCPTGTTQYITGFESSWDNRKSCTSCPANYPLYDSTNDTCYAQVTFIDSDNSSLLKKEDVYYDGNNGSGYNLPSYSPTKPDTVIDNWENGSGTVIAANDVLTGNQVVYSDWGFHCDSGRYFHIGNEQICAAETKRTEHAMVIQFDPEHTYYIHATPNSEHDYTINSSSIHKMKANYNGTIYNLHDASVYFDN